MPICWYDLVIGIRCEDAAFVQSHQQSEPGGPSKIKTAGGPRFAPPFLRECTSMSQNHFSAASWIRKAQVLPTQFRLWLLLGVTLQFCACASPSAPPTDSATRSLRPLPTVSAPTIPGVPSRRVSFVTSDSVQLDGWMYGRGRTVVVCSEQYMTGDGIWTGSGIAEQLVARGYAVLAYDFRGVGASSGSPERSLLDVDLRAAITYVRLQGATRVALLGVSMGGTASLNVAGTDPVAAVITLSAPQAFGVTVTNADLITDRAPKLFINSDGDAYAAATARMYRLAVSPKQLHLYPGSAHGIDLFAGVESGDVSQRILNFLAIYAPAD
jgi:uncharacterized protein